jgi:signal transduction histidine kinase
MRDGLGQELTAAKMMLDTIQAGDVKEKTAEASRLVANALQQVRSITHLLHPPLLDEAGLCSAIRWYLEGLTKRSGIETSLEVSPDFPRFAPELETAMYRIVQEALTNAFRHAGTRNAWVTLLTEENRVVVRVRDYGKGIAEDVLNFRPPSIGVGIGGMRQRVKEFGGELRLQNANPGTLVEAVIPLKSSALLAVAVSATTP